LIYKEEIKDLFTVDRNEYSFAHCISHDCAMGAGIAVRMKREFDLYDLKNAIDSCPVPLKVPYAFYYHKVYNLVTKEMYYHNPTYESIEKTLFDMYYHSTSNGISKIAIPMIGCGIDGLNWAKVKKIICQVFDQSNIEILVCFFS
jgi:O-acetyl-ADP-ribose deacetylase (regulator of RNase III)